MEGRKLVIEIASKSGLKFVVLDNIDKWNERQH
jgi:hypothetical protein